VYNVIQTEFKFKIRERDMTRKVRILGVQFTPELGNKELNLRKAEFFIENNMWFKPDLVVLPEVFNSGFGSNIQGQAEFIPDGTTAGLMSNLASKYSTNIIAGSYAEKCPEGKLKNTSVVFNRSGAIIGKYQKIHLFSHYGFNEAEFFTAGDKAVIVETDIGKIGLSICYDIRFPELYRSLTYAGAEIIVCCANWPYQRLDHWLTLNRARAIENQIFFISSNQVGKVQEGLIAAGHSMVINPWGDIIASAGGEEGVVLTEIDLDAVKKLREDFPALDDRNLDAYEIQSLSD